MKILYLTNYQGPTVVAQRGHKLTRTLGASRKVELLTRGLARQGHQVHVVSPATVRESTGRWYRGFDCQEVDCGTAPVTYLPALDVPRLNLLVASRVLDRFLRRAAGHDLVLLYNLEWYFLAPAAAHARARGLPLVVEYEDDALSDVGVRLKWWHMARGRKAVALARQAVDGVVAVAPELAQQLGQENAVVLPGLLGDDALGTPRAPARQAGAPVRLVYAGGMTRDKGPDLLVEAARLVRHPVEVDIAGSGIELPRIRTQAQASGAVVRVHGEVSRAEILGLLGGADLAVNPHRMGDARLGQIFPFKIVEYLGAGLPVVTSRLGELPAEMREPLVTYHADTPEGLARAIDQAIEGLSGLRLAAERARAWVAGEYSSAAAGKKVEQVLLAAQRRRAALESAA